nr:RNA-directed DNA polymerase, eukaryota, reverse transcriptase zinc-binding domain protein [Tanacetum cinerariifolium]
MWKNIERANNKVNELESLFDKFFVIKVSNGQDTWFWLDPWCNGGVKLSDTFPKLYALEEYKDCKIDERWNLINNDIWEWAWDNSGSRPSEKDEIRVCGECAYKRSEARETGIERERKGKEKWAARGVFAKKDLIDKRIKDYESKEKDELFHIIRNRATILKQQRLLDEQTKIIAERQNLLKSVRDVMKEAKAFIEKATSNSVVDDKSAPADDEGLLGLKKRYTLLD